MDHLHKWQYLNMKINIPELSLVLLIGTSGSGKTTFANKHFEKHEIVSSDICRGIVSNNENNQLASKDAFELLNFIISKRLKNGLLTVVDATNIQPESRQKLVKLAKQFHTLPAAIVLDMPQKLCVERNAKRADRNLKPYVVNLQKSQLKKSIKKLKREGFRKIYVLKSEEEVDSVTNIVRDKLYNDKKELSGPFDIIGDIHGCFDETIALLNKMDYQFTQVENDGQNYGLNVSHPEKRMVIFLGDLVDRGPKSPEVLKLVMGMVSSGVAICVPGNHDLKLQKKLNGKNVQLNHGLAETMAQLENESDEFKRDVREFLYSLISHYILDNGRLAVAHAGIKEEMQGRGSGAVRSFCLYGETTGEIDSFGLPVRYNWAKEYRGRAKVIYGHTPVKHAEWLNNTMDIDTGCVFGGELTALRYPEEELVSVKAKKVYAIPSKPIEVSTKEILNAQQEHDDLLNIEDVTGKRIIQTRLRNNLTIREENSIAALEVMSRFAVNPKWLIYLPPTMSPCATSELDDFLEHPQQAINYYRKRGVNKIICEEKHMGSRAVIIVCKNEKTVLDRFGIKNEGIGICFTRTGRNFFNDKKLEGQFLRKIQKALNISNFWDKFNTDWTCLDAELMPWSAKAQALLSNQYAAVGSAAKNAISDVEKVLQKTAERNIEGIEALQNQFKKKGNSIEKFVQSYRNYCWVVKSIEDYKLAPFHILATEGHVHFDKNHKWHMENIKEFCKTDESFFKRTAYKIVDMQNPNEINDAVNWWLELTKNGGEGMVVKPFDFITKTKDGLLQPAVKCRGKEYLRIIYGAEYDRPENLVLLKKRSMSKKQSLALREFALGLEGLERFVRNEPLRKIHESIFAVLALESEPVDPRL